MIVPQTMRNVLKQSAMVNELLFDDTASGYRHYERRNSDGAQVAGISADLGMIFGEHFRMQLGGTWQYSRYIGQGREWDEDKYENRMERMPDIYSHLSATYTPDKRLSFMATGTFTGSMLVYHTTTQQFNNSTVQQVITPSFFDLTLKASYNISFGVRTTLEINGGVQNLFNSFQRDFDRGPYRDASYIYGPTLPRTIFLGAKLVL